VALWRRVSEGVARKTTRRGFFGRGADVAFGALAGVAAGTITRGRPVSATHVLDTVCAFPGPPCACDKCLENGVCAKPCVILTTFYASGCWVAGAGVTCCDCDCQGLPDVHGNPATACGCGSDYHNDPHNCP
jgi:hypothetical protein